MEARKIQIVAEGFDGFRKDLGFFDHVFEVRIPVIEGLSTKKGSRFEITHRLFRFSSWLCDQPPIALYKEVR